MTSSHHVVLPLVSLLGLAGCGSNSGAGASSAGWSSDAALPDEDGGTVVAADSSTPDGDSGQGSDGGGPGADGGTHGDAGPAGSATDVTTYHNDNSRTGLNANETVLTPANVNVSTFGKLAFYATDGIVYGQPLYLHAVTIAGHTHEILYVTTNNASVYAFDVDSGMPLWRVQTLKSGEIPSDDDNCPDVPQVGILATPVIDRTMGPHGAIYVETMLKDGAGNYHHRLTALDVTTGAELFGGPVEVTATYTSPATNNTVTFDPRQYSERSALLAANGRIYTTWSSHCDNPPYTSWIMSYDETTLAQKVVFDAVPNGGGGGLWMGGSGPAADSAGNVFVIAGNGDFDSNALDANGKPKDEDYGNALMKLSPDLKLLDYFWSDTETGVDVDLGATGPLLLPDLTDSSGTPRHLVLAAGKTSNIFVLDRDDLGKSMGSQAAYQYLPQVLYGGATGGGPAYFDGTVYYSAFLQPMRALTITGAKATLRSDQTMASNESYSQGPSISANGTKDGILWVIDRINGIGAVLRAYDPADLTTEFYDSEQNSMRDRPNGDSDPELHFMSPTVTDGRVYVQTSTGVAVYGHL